MKCGCSIYFFLNSANLVCGGTDISKYFRGSPGLRDETQLYIFFLWIKKHKCSVFVKVMFCDVVLYHSNLLRYHGRAVPFLGIQYLYYLKNCKKPFFFQYLSSNAKSLQCKTFYLHPEEHSLAFSYLLILHTVDLVFLLPS